MNKELLELKKRMQEARNIAKNLHCVRVIHFFEPGEGSISLIDFKGMGVYSTYKTPDIVIDIDAAEQEISDLIQLKSNLENGQIIYLLLWNGIWTKVQVLDADMLVKDYYSGYHHLSFIDVDMKKMYEFGDDSRDEYHHLYDVYEVKFPVQMDARLLGEK